MRHYTYICKKCGADAWFEPELDYPSQRIPEMKCECGELMECTGSQLKTNWVELPNLMFDKIHQPDPEAKK